MEPKASSDRGVTLVTGVSGFVGGRLFERLHGSGGSPCRGWSRRPPARYSDRWEEVDLVEGSRSEGDSPAIGAALDRIEPTAIYHLAAMANPRACEADPDLARATNVRAARALFREAGRIGAPVLFASSAAVYGPSSEPHAESEEPDPRGVYGATKLLAERAAVEAVQGGARIVIARSFNHSGPGQSAEYALGAFAAKLAAARGNDGSIRVGNLLAVRDFLHVDDVLDAYEVLLERGEPGVPYNVCSGAGVQLGELYRRLGERFGFSAEELDQRTRPFEGSLNAADVLVGDASKLTALGWCPKCSWDELLDDIARPLL